jgi:hypothetical protein
MKKEYCSGSLRDLAEIVMSYSNTAKSEKVAWSATSFSAKLRLTISAERPDRCRSFEVGFAVGVRAAAFHPAFSVVLE